MIKMLLPNRCYAEDYKEQQENIELRKGFNFKKDEIEKRLFKDVTLEAKQMLPLNSYCMFAEDNKEKIQFEIYGEKGCLSNKVTFRFAIAFNGKVLSEREFFHVCSQGTFKSKELQTLVQNIKQFIFDYKDEEIEDEIELSYATV